MTTPPVERFVETADGSRLWTASQGTGPPLLLASGGPGCCDYLKPVADMVDDIVTVVRFEQRGCGRSSTASRCDVMTSIEDLETIRRAYGWERWHLGGHSWGADLALAYATEHPDRTTGILALAGGRVANDRDWHQVYRSGRDGPGEWVPEWDFPPNFTVNRVLNDDWNRYIKRPSLWRDIARLPMPFHAIWGSADIRQSWPTEQIAAAIPRGSFTLIEGAQHFLWHTPQHAMKLRELMRTTLRLLTTP